MPDDDEHVLARERRRPLYLVAHADFGDPECCGLLVIEPSGREANITCNQCGAVIRTVPAEKAEATLAEMSSDEICSARCTHCGALNVFPGFSAIDAFICRECGEGVSLKASTE